jgi:hypothetical protein
MSSVPFFILTGLINMRNDFEKPDTKRKYGALVLNLKTDEPPRYIFNFLFMLRRMIYSLSMAFLKSNPSA